MLIHFGRKIVRRADGADEHFCPVCNVVCPLEWTSLWMCVHLYHIAIGNGKRIGSEGRCVSCGVRIRGDHLLAGRTHGLGGPATAESEFHRHCERGSLSERRASIALHRIQVLDYENELWLKRGSSASVTAVWQFLFIICSFVAAVAFYMYFDEQRTVRNDMLLLGGVASLCALMSLAIALGRMAWKRPAQSLHRVARSLGPLRLNPAELDAVVNEARLKKVGIASQLDIAKLRNAIALDESGFSGRPGR